MSLFWSSISNLFRDFPDSCCLKGCDWCFLDGKIHISICSSFSDPVDRRSPKPLKKDGKNLNISDDYCTQNKKLCSTHFLQNIWLQMCPVSSLRMNKLYFGLLNYVSRFIASNTCTGNYSGNVFCEVFLDGFFRANPLYRRDFLSGHGLLTSHAELRFRSCYLSLLTTKWVNDSCWNFPYDVMYCPFHTRRAVVFS